MEFPLIIILFLALTDFTYISMKRLPNNNPNNNKVPPNEPTENREKDKPTGISGGSPVAEGEAKFMVLIYMFDQSTGEYSQQGSGMVLNARFVLTAGHVCFDFYKDKVPFYMFFGGYPLEKLHDHRDHIRYGTNFNVTDDFVISYTEHELNPGLIWVEDVCIVKLSQPIWNLRDVTPVHLPPPIDPNYIDYYIERYVDPNDCWSIGYGREWVERNFGNINKVKIPVYGLDAVIYTLLEAFTRIYPPQTTDPLMVLKGDSGGALMCRLRSAPPVGNDFNQNYVLMGVINSHANRRIPFDPNFLYISYYEPVRYFRPWIDSHLQHPDLAEHWSRFVLPPSNTSL